MPLCTVTVHLPIVATDPVSRPKILQYAIVVNVCAYSFAHTTALMCCFIGVCIQNGDDNCLDTSI